jgi:hypothetical protein
MKARPTVAQWLFLAFGAGLLAAVLVVRQRGDLRKLAEDGELVRLRAERQSVAAFEPAAVRALQAAVDALDDGSGKRSNCPEGWSAQAVPSSEGANRIRWSVRPTGTPTWTALVSATSALAAVPGNRIVSLAVRSRGTLNEREIASVEILLEQPTPTPSRRNPSDGTGWPGAVGPATPPAAGAGPSLRRPAASAEPPAAGQASAPVRPAPRGPRAGSLSTHQPQPRKS